MGKAGRIACIFTPMALTIASFVCMIFIEIGGWSSGSSTLNNLYFMKADFTNITTATAGDLSNSTTLTAALELAKNNNELADIYEIHLWNYCQTNESDTTIDYCSSRSGSFWFDPIEVWHLNATNTTSLSTPTGSTELPSAVQSEEAKLENNATALETSLLGKSAADGLKAYKDVSKWMFIAYEIAFWTTLATILCGILAIFSRWGSFLTWLFSIVSSLFAFASSLTATILFAVLTGALKTVLDPYNIKISLGTHALAVTWLGTAFSLGATLFWLFSVCCCSGKSNPHHRSNKGALWNAEPKGQGYNDYGRGRGLKVEKTGGYERVGSPFIGGHDADTVPLTNYPQQPTGYGRGMHPGGQYEPFRHA